MVGPEKLYWNTTVSTHNTNEQVFIYDVNSNDEHVAGRNQDDKSSDASIYGPNLENGEHCSGFQSRKDKTECTSSHADPLTTSISVTMLTTLQALHLQEKWIDLRLDFAGSSIGLRTTEKIGMSSQLQLRKGGWTYWDGLRIKQTIYIKDN